MADAPETLTLPGAGVELGALAWGPADGPLALCLHGFPDTAWTWRRVGPRLAAAGWRVVAPFLRGYSPSGLAGDGDHSLHAYADDALTLRRHFAGRRAVLIGHDWGAVAAYALAARPPGDFEAIVTLSIPPLAVLADPGRLLTRPRMAARQTALSSYMAWNLVPGLAEHSLPWLVPALWRRWSPGYDGAGDVARVLAALGTPARRTAALRPYRALLLPWARRGRPLRPALGHPRTAVLALHGERDGCIHPETARAGASLLPAGRFLTIPDAGHFLALEQPASVAEKILRFVGLGAAHGG